MSFPEHCSVGIVGCGRVGITTAFSLLHRDFLQELVLVGRSIDKVTARAQDLAQGQIFLSDTTIIPTISIDRLSNCDVVIFAAGVAQNPNQPRTDLFNENQSIVSNILPEIAQAAPNAIIIIVSNPVDALTQYAVACSSYKHNQVIGTGTLLDTARFRHFLGQKLKASAKSIQAYMLGEHGHQAVPVLSSARMGDQKITELLTSEQLDAAVTRTTSAAASIIAGAGATEYAIGAATAELVKTILSDSKTVLPVSSVLQGELGLRDVALSLPCILGRNGIDRVLKPSLDDREVTALQQAASKVAGLQAY